MTVVSTTPTTYYNAFQTTLKRSMTSASQTTGIILNPIYDNDGVFVTYTTTPLLLTFIQGTKKEIISAGGFTQDAAGAITLTDVTRDLPRNGSSYTGQGNPVKFTSNATVLVGVTAQSMNKTVFKDAANTFTGLQTFTGGALPPTFADATARDAAFPSPTNGLLIYNTALGVLQQYIGGTWADVGDAGTANGSTTVAGKYEEATVAEQGSATATGATGARLVPAVANLVKTSSGAGDENKIAILNASGNFDTGFTGLATGMISPYAGSAAPTGWLLCYGQAVSRTTYADLYTVTSTTYGAGDGSTTFNLPDMRGRFPLGKDDMGGSSANRVVHAQADILGGSTGAETHTLIEAELPSHSHTSTQYANGSNVHDNTRHTNEGYNNGTGSTVTTGNGSTGGDTAHNNMPPYITLNYIIKT